MLTKVGVIALEKELMERRITGKREQSKMEKLLVILEDMMQHMRMNITKIIQLINLIF